MVCKSFGYRVTRASHESKNQRWDDKKAVLFPPGADKETPILSYGDKSLRPSMRGHGALPVKHIREFFSETMITIMVDEFRTSAMCSFCGEPLATPRAIAPLGEETTQERWDRLKTTYPLEQCAHCRTVWNRDFNASRNMMGQELTRYWSFGLFHFDGQPIGMPERRFIGADTATAHSLHSAAAATAPPSAAAATWKLSTKRADETF